MAEPPVIQITPDHCVLPIDFLREILQIHALYLAGKLVHSEDAFTNEPSDIELEDNPPREDAPDEEGTPLEGQTREEIISRHTTLGMEQVSPDEIKAILKEEEPTDEPGSD